jgi:hypothetical protein
VIRSRSAARAGDAVHWRFRPKPGSGYIASGFALGAVIHHVERHRPASILEVGAGIGTLTAAVAEAADRANLACSHVAVEDIPFCLEQLAANLGHRLDGVVVIPHAADLPAEVPPFDLVVIDGGSTDDLLPEDRHRWTDDDERAEVGAWIDRLAPGAFVIVENERPRQRRWIEGAARRPFVHEHIRPYDGSPGFHRYRFDPGPAHRVGAALAGRLRALWFPWGVRVMRLAHARLTGRIGPDRAAVARGGDDPPDATPPT